MAKSKATIATTASINARTFAAKERRRLEKTNYPPEVKMEIVEKLRDATRELRTKARLIEKGTVNKA